MKKINKANKFLSQFNEQEDNEELKIIQFFKENPDPSDDKVHTFAEKNKIDEHKFEEMIYKLVSDIFAQGEANKKGITRDKVNSKELELGIKIEMEHTSNPLIAERIALDHLAEIPDYYTRLIAMEKEAKEKK